MQQFLPNLDQEQTSVDDRVRNLTIRERNVLEAMLRPESTKQTARRMGLSPRTVETHRSRVLAKLGARNVHELVVLFARPEIGVADERSPRTGLGDGGLTRGHAMMGGAVCQSGFLSGLTYSPRLDPSCITVMLVWGEEDARFGYIVMPDGVSQQVEGPSGSEPIPAEGAIAYGVYLALATRTRLRLGGDISVWDADWGPLQHATSPTRLS